MELSMGIFICQGVISALSFIAGAYIYRKGIEQAPVFPFNPEKKEKESTPSWDEV